LQSKNLGCERRSEESDLGNPRAHRQVEGRGDAVMRNDVRVARMEKTSPDVFMTAVVLVVYAVQAKNEALYNGRCKAVSQAVSIRTSRIQRR